jgi:hypothetical protein
VTTQQVEEEFGSSISSSSYSTTGPLHLLHTNEPNDAFEVILYVPSEPLLFEDVQDKGNQSEALAIHGNRLIILQQPNTTIHHSMSYLSPVFDEHNWYR